MCESSGEYLGHLFLLYFLNKKQLLINVKNMNKSLKDTNSQKERNKSFLHCRFASHFWLIILEACGWSLMFPNNVFNILASVLVVPPFGGTQQVLWMGIVCAFLWLLWGESNVHFFRDTSSSFDCFIDNFIYCIFLVYNKIHVCSL